MLNETLSSRAQSKDPDALLKGGNSGFLDFARNDPLIPSKFLISVFAGDWPD